MRALRSVLFALAACAVAAPAVGGTLDAFQFSPSATAPITPIPPPNPITGTPSNVTYSAPASGKLPALTTYVGFNVGDTSKGVLLQNTSGNTLNHITITITFTVTNPLEKLALWNTAKYPIPSSCSWSPVAPANPLSVICSVDQMKAGDTFPAFTVFFVTPQNACTTPPCAPDGISSDVNVLYAEGTNGGPSSPPNSYTGDIVQTNLVVLGTNNPVNVISAVPTDGSKIFTGKGGVPLSTDISNNFAELGTIPGLSSIYTVAQITINPTGANDAQCTNLGHFKNCPTFETQIAYNNVESLFLDPNNPVITVFRVDSSNLKMSWQKILNSVTFTYTGIKFTINPDKTITSLGSYSDEPVPMTCSASNNQPTGTGLPCVLTSKCYKNLNDAGGNPDLVGDCEWTLINTNNGLLKLQ